MKGGSISGNISGGSYAEGVYTSTESNDTIVVGETATITNNMIRKNGIDTVNNLRLYGNKMTVLNGFSGNIEMTLRTVPTKEVPVDFTKNNKADYSKYFFSDNAAYEIVNAGSGSSQ